MISLSTNTESPIDWSSQDESCSRNNNLLYCEWRPLWKMHVSECFCCTGAVASLLTWRGTDQKYELCSLLTEKFFVFIWLYNFVLQDALEHDVFSSRFTRKYNKHNISQVYFHTIFHCDWFIQPQCLGLHHNLNSDVSELVRTRTFTLKIKTLLSHPVSHRIIQQPNPVCNITVVDGHP